MDRSNSHQNKTFEDIKLENTSLANIEFYNCSFINCIFNHIDFSGSSFEDCKFISCNIIVPKLLDSRFQIVSFNECKISGAIFSVLNDFSVSFSIEDSSLISCTFSDMMLARTSFEHCKFDDTLFSNCNLRLANFSYTTFKASQITSCDLRESSFLESSGFNINPNENKMNNARFNISNALELLNCYRLKYQ